MSYTVFISHNTSQEEQVFVYRLQTLAAASDIVVLLPQRNGQKISAESKLRIDSADCIIAFLTSKLTSQVREELAYAEEKGKLIIAVYETGIAPPASAKSIKWIPYDPKKDTPGSVEQKVAGFLKEKKQEKHNREAIVLVGLGLGLLWLISSNK